MEVDGLGSADVSALVRMLGRGPLNMNQFRITSQASLEQARRARDRLEGMGLLHVALTSSGAVEVATITLTPLGRAFAEHLANGNAVLERAKRERFP